MATFLLAQLKLKYGFANLERYTAAMPQVRALFEQQGIRLRLGTITAVGPLYEAWNVWELEDQGHLARAIEGWAEDPAAFAAASTAMDEVVESEDTRLLDSLPFSPA